MNKTVVMNLTSISMVNGEITDTIFVNERGLAFGDGVFETMRFENNQLPFFQLHLQRLHSGCERLGIPLDLKQPQRTLTSFRSHLTHLGCRSGVVKITVMRGVDDGA